MQQPTDKFAFCEDFEEIFAMVFDDPEEGGESGLRKLLSATDRVAREALEDAALGLADAGMHRAAQIVREAAPSHPLEVELEVCPYVSATDVRAWHAAQPRRMARSRWWREEKRRRKRAGTWW